MRTNFVNSPNIDMSLNIPSPKTNWSTSKTEKSSVPDYTNLGLIHVPSVNPNSIEVIPQQTDSFVLLPSLDQTEEKTTLQPKEASIAEVYIGQALVYFEQQQWSESIASCQEALRVYPQMGMAYKVWGNCLQRSGKTAEAIGIYAKAIEAKADMAEIYCNLGSIYAKQRKWQQAIENYQKSIVINPKNATPYRNLARVWDELGKSDKSAECFFKAINLEPSLLSAQNHFNLANTLIADGNRIQAISCYKNCVELEPKFLNAYARLADALEQEGQTEEALFYYKRLAQLQTAEELPEKVPSKSAQQISSLLKSSAKSIKQVASDTPRQIMRLPESKEKQGVLRLQPAQPAKTTTEEKIAQCLQQASQQPNSASIQFELGNLYAQEQKWQKAIACYQRATQIAPKKAQYHVHLGKALSQAKYNLQSNLAYYNGFSLEPQRASAKNHYSLGDRLLQQNEIEKAIACYRRAISKQPDLIEAYWRLGEILTEKSDQKAALACYRRALKIAPKRIQNYVLLGKALEQQGNWQGALAYYQQAVILEPDNVEMYGNLGQALTNLQRYDEATKILRQGISRNAQYWKTYYQLGDTLSHQELWYEAAGAYEKAISLNPEDFSLAHYYLGQACLEIQQWHKAVDAFSRGIKLNFDSSYNSSLAYYGLGYALSELQRWNLAIKALTNSIKLNPKFERAYQKLGDVKGKIQDWNGAISAYQQALSINPELSDTGVKLKEALKQSSNPDITGTDNQIPSQQNPSSSKQQESSLQEVLAELPSEPEVYLTSSSFDEN